MHAVALPRRSRSSSRFGPLVSTLLGLVLLLTGACATQLIAPYDEYTFTRAAQMAEECELLFVALEDAATTSAVEDDLYAAHADSYQGLIAAVRSLEGRAKQIEKNRIPRKQLELLRESLEKMQAEHRSRSSAAEPKGFSATALAVLREPMMQQFNAIVVLQEELKVR